MYFYKVSTSTSGILFIFYDMLSGSSIIIGTVTVFDANVYLSMTQ